MLERAGLRSGDYSLVRAGGGLQRFEALLKKEHAATLLFTPFELIAQEKGFHDLGAAIDAFGHYQGLVAAAQRSWLHGHRAEAIGYIRGYVAGLDWLYDRANKEAAIALLRRNITTMSPEIAEKTYAVLLDPKLGLLKKGKLDIAGVRTVLALRSQYGEPKKRLGNPEKYIDLSFYKAALGG